MSGARTYAFLQARLRSLMPRLAGPATLAELIGQDRERRGALLDAMGLPELGDGGAAEPADLEQILISRLVEESASLLRPLSGAPRKVVAHWMRRFELINLKVLLRGKEMGAPSGELRAQLVDMGPLAALPVEDLLHADDVPDLLRQLEATVYAPVARRAERVFAEQRRLFDVEAAMDRDHYAALVQHTTHLPATERRALTPLMGRLIDQINLTWLLRYRLNAGLAPPHTYFLLVPSPFQIGGEQLQGLARLESLEAMLAALPETVGQGVSDCRSVREVEERMGAATAEAADHLLRRTVFQAGQALAYLLLRERQMLAIHAALKGDRLRLDGDLIREAAGLAG
jgi:V/A-type H+-transporting ATPase subunit C